MIEYADTLECARSRPVSYDGIDDTNTGLEWDIELPLPPSYPTSAAAGRGVLLDVDTLVETIHTESENTRAAHIAEFRRRFANTELPAAAMDARRSAAVYENGSRYGSRYLELSVIIFRRSDGRVCCPSEDMCLDFVDKRNGALEFRVARLPSPPQVPVALKARLAPRLPLPAGAVARDARICWTLSLEVATLDEEYNSATRFAEHIRIQPNGWLDVGRNAPRLEDDRAHAEDGMTMWGVAIDWTAGQVHVRPVPPSLHAVFEKMILWE